MFDYYNNIIKQVFFLNYLLFYTIADFKLGTNYSDK